MYEEAVKKVEELMPENTALKATNASLESEITSLKGQLAAAQRAPLSFSEPVSAMVKTGLWDLTGPTVKKVAIAVCPDLGIGTSMAKDAMIEAVAAKIAGVHAPAEGRLQKMTSAARHWKSKYDELVAKQPPA